MTTAHLAKTYGTRNKGTGIPSRALNPGLIQYTEVEISSAEVLAAFATPVEVIPAPGDGRVLEFISAVMILDHGGTDYANARTCHFEYYGGGTTVSDTVAAATFINQADDCIVVCQALSAEAELSANTAICWALDTGEVITGNSPLRMKVSFRVYEAEL